MNVHRNKLLLNSCDCGFLVSTTEKKPVRAEIYLDFDENIYLFIYTSMCQGEHFADNL